MVRDWFLSTTLRHDNGVERLVKTGLVFSPVRMAALELCGPEQDDSSHLHGPSRLFHEDAEESPLAVIIQE